LPFQIIVSNRDKQALNVTILVINSRGLIVRAERQGLYFTVSAGTYQRGTYESAFIPTAESIRGITEQRVRRIPLFYPPPSMKVETLRFAPGVIPQKFDDRELPTDFLPNDKENNWKDLLPGKRSERQPAFSLQALLGVRDAHADGPYTVTGRLLFQSKAGAAVPAWGWTVQISQARPDGPRAIAGTSVDHMGHWRALFNSARLDPSLPLVVSYRPANRLFKLVDRDGVVPVAVEDPRPVSGSGFDMGTSLLGFSAAFWGMGDVYQAGTLMWNGFRSAGIDAIRRREPIRIYFPNTWELCGDPSGPPWSCATSDGSQIWLAHIDAYTVMHELGHSISSKFWSGQPDGAGGPHDGISCENGGLALSEGFADVMAFFAHGLYFLPSPGGAMDGGYDLETTADSSICAGERNEFRVAQSLWDIIDIPNDGGDTFYMGKDRPGTELYGRPARLINIVLANRRNAVSLYLADIRADVDGIPNKDAVNAIFIANTIMVPPR
jgi:hypothetical protein